MRIVIRTGKFYDGSAGAPRENVTFVVANGGARIAAEGESLDAERTYEAAAVTPGLINCHVHLEMNGEPNTQTCYILRDTNQRVLYAAHNARLTLEAGITTVRDLGASDGIAIAVRDAIARGEHAGPTVLPAGRALCMTGGHGFFLGRETDGPWDARKGVREQRRAGASVIKLIATGGVLTKGAVPGQDQLSEEELRAAVEEAHTHEMIVGAHAIGTGGINNALRAGVDSIEHGHLLDDESIALFKERGAYLVPTIAAVSRIYENAQNGAQPDYVVRKATELYEKVGENVGRAWRAGVKIAGGSDAGTPYNYHQEYAYELELMVSMLGMTPQQALTAATQTAAELLRIDTAGDLLLLDADPGADARAFRAPRVVIKGGTVAFERA